MNRIGCLAFVLLIGSVLGSTIEEKIDLDYEIITNTLKGVPIGIGFLKKFEKEKEILISSPAIDCVVNQAIDSTAYDSCSKIVTEKYLVGRYQVSIYQGNLRDSVIYLQDTCLKFTCKKMLGKSMFLKKTESGIEGISIGKQEKGIGNRINWVIRFKAGKEPKSKNELEYRKQISTYEWMLDSNKVIRPHR
jgi:hypothetical protein